MATSRRPMPTALLGRIAWASAIFLLLAVHGCAPVGEPEQKRRLDPVGFRALPGWTEGRHAAALSAFRRSCPKLVESGSSAGDLAIPAADWSRVCAAAARVPEGDDAAARAFFEAEFRPHAVSDAGDATGLFTGYFEAELRGARSPGGKYEVPLHGLPADLVAVDFGTFATDLKGRRAVGRVEDGRLVAYHTRGAIRTGAMDGAAPVLAWVDDVIDAYLLQVQGSGRVKLPDGSVLRVGFAGHNGYPYVSIGKALIERGELPPHGAGWDGIRGWIERNPEKADELFALNPRYVFFRELTGEGPIGAQGVALTPERSLAVDRRFVPLGAPLWLDTVRPGREKKPLRRLMIAQDTGGAIKGIVRGDFFWGYGEKALAEAGRMKSRGRYFLLLPKPAVGKVSQR